MNVRIAEKDDFNKIKYIWKYCFNDPEGFFNYYFENKYKEENNLVAEEDNNIISSLQLNQYNIVLNNKVYNTSYVVGVSTLPEGRGRGFMKSLIQSSLDEMYKRNQFISILMPIDYRLYRYYGYEHCYDQLEYSIDIELLKDFKINGTFKRASLDDIPHMIYIYNNSLKGKNGFIFRDENYFESLFNEVDSENGYIYIHKDEFGFDGYIIYFEVDGNLFIREIFYENIDSLNSFLKFIYNHNTQFKKVIINTPIDDKIKYIIPNLKNIDIKIKPFMMGRIIDFKGFMKSLKIEDINYNLNIKVEDKFIKENDKVFNISIKNGDISVLETYEKEDVSVDINTLSQLAFSYIDVEEALFLKKISILDEKHIYILNKLFRKKINYINEYI